MGSLIKQTVNSVVFVQNMSHADDVRCLILEIGCEGAGRFFKLRTEKEGSEIYFGSPDHFRLIYETALSMWQQGDIYAPGDTDNDLIGDMSATLSSMMPILS